MSRTWHRAKASKVGIGKEYWKSRLHRYGEVIGKITKILTHRKERRKSKQIEKQALKGELK